MICNIRHCRMFHHLEMLRAERDSRWRRSQPAEGRPSANRNPLTRRFHSRGYGPSEIADEGKPRPHPISRTRSPQAPRIPVPRYHCPRIFHVTALSSASGCHNCGWALASPRLSPVRRTENLPWARAPCARIRPPRPRLAPNHGPQDRVPPARSEEKTSRVRAARPGLPKSMQATATEASAEHPPLTADKQDNYDPSSTPRQSMTYAQAVARGQTDKTRTTQDEWMTRRHNHKSRRQVDPRKDGRCFRCLAREHIARDCRDPIKYHLCQKGGHRQASCPLQLHTPAKPPSLAACLVGESREIDPQWAHIMSGIQTLCPNLSSPDCHRLDSGDFFLRGLSKADWCRIHGKIQQIPGGGAITWRRPQSTDGAIIPHKKVRRLEACGIPFGFRMRHHLQQLVRPIGVLQELVCDGILAGDPNCTGLEVEMANDDDIPDKLSLALGGGRCVDIQIAVMPPPPPPLNLSAHNLHPARVPR